MPVTDGNFLKLDNAQLATLLANKPEMIRFDVPRGENQTVTMKLARVNLTTDDFTVGTKGTNAQESVPYKHGIHYRGIVEGDDQSVAALSFYNDDLMGFYATSDGNYDIGKLEGEDNLFAVYKSKYMGGQLAFGIVSGRFIFDAETAFSPCI
jgi:hypothetical protein